MRLGIVACDILKNEIEHLTKDDPDFVRREYLEFALHVYPDEMRAKIEDTVNSFKEEVDAVLVGYGICSSLTGLTDALDVPAVMLDGADCIDALLGPDEYNGEKRNCIGTWFSSPGWAEQGVEGLIKELRLDTAEGYDPKFFLDIIFDSYERCLFVDSGVGDTAQLRKRSEDMAEYLGLRHECRACGLSKIEEAVLKVKELGASKVS